MTTGFAGERGPEVFETSIGNGLVGYFTLRLEGDRLLYQAPTPDSPDGDQWEEIPVAPDDWRRFRRSLIRLDVWSWDQHYATPDVMDGTYWDVRVVWGDQKVESSGSNGYPGTDASSPGQRFAGFCRAVSRLAGGREFR